MQDPDGRLLYLIENLTSLHAAADLPWLAGRFEFLGEHALGAALTALVLPDDAGRWRPALSSSPRPAYVKVLWESLEVDRLGANEAAVVALQAAATSAQPLTITTAELFGDGADGSLEATILAPVTFNREAVGVGMFLVHEPDTMSETIAGVLAGHAAVAVLQLRERDQARRLHSVDSRLWVPDENFLRAQLIREVARARRYHRELGVVLLRLDNEADVRRQFGDFYTDHLLRRIGGHLMASVRDTDVLGALQGAFGVIHTETGSEGTSISAHRLQDGVIKAIATQFPEAPPLQFSLEMAMFPAQGDTADDLVSHLFAALETNSAAA